jgi:eukaryotic-like serine/threonine-protein kinase
MKGDGFLDRTGHRMWGPDNWARVKEVFAGARALSADSRPAYLAEACAGDGALRQEVESLLASDQRAKSFLEAPAMVRGDDARDQATLMMEGQRLGVYRVQALLGAGGMGRCTARATRSSSEMSRSSSCRTHS